MIRMNKLTIATSLLLLVSCLACTTEEVVFDADVQLAADVEVISAYVQDNNIPAMQHESGFYYIVNEPGDAAPINNKCELRFRLEVYGLDSTFYFSTIRESELLSPQNPREITYDLFPCYGFDLQSRFVLNQLQGLIGLGGQIDMVVPSGLAWANQGYERWLYPYVEGQPRMINIPPHTNVLMSAELIYAE